MDGGPAWRLSVRDGKLTDETIDTVETPARRPYIRDWRNTELDGTSFMALRRADACVEASYPRCVLRPRGDFAFTTTMTCGWIETLAPAWRPCIYDWHRWAREDVRAFDRPMQCRDA